MRKVTGPAGSVDTTFGTTRFATAQLGGVVELTSTFSPTTGYSWKRLAQAGSGFSNPTIQETGDRAFTPDGNQGLAVGTRGWLEPDPDRNAWVFIPEGTGGGGTPEIEYAYNSPDYSTFSTTNPGSWEDTGSVITDLSLPEAGTYLIQCSFSATVSGQTTAGAALGFRLYDETAAAAVAGSGGTISNRDSSLPATQTLATGSHVTILVPYTVSGASVIRLEVIVSTNLGDQGQVVGSNAGGAEQSTNFGYIRLA